MTLTDILTRPRSDTARGDARRRSMLEDAPASPWAAWQRPAPSARRAWWSRVDWRRARYNAATFAAVIGCNGLAATGQALWAHGALFSWWPAAVAVAAVVESIAVYLAVEAHAALMAGDAAFGRRVASYGAAGVVGYLNWLHWTEGHGPNARAFMFAGLSVISPWLWSLRSRSAHRDLLRSKGLIDARLPRFSAARWLFHPVRTLRVLWWASWEGLTDPAAAISGWEEHRKVAAPPAPPVEAAVVKVAPALKVGPPNPVEAVEVPPAAPADPKPRKAAPSGPSGLAAKAERIALERYAADGKWPTVPELARLAGVSESTADRARGRAKREVSS